MAQGCRFALCQRASGSSYGEVWITGIQQHIKQTQVKVGKKAFLPQRGINLVLCVDSIFALELVFLFLFTSRVKRSNELLGVSLMHMNYGGFRRT